MRSKLSLNTRKAHRGAKERRWKRRKEKDPVPGNAHVGGVPRGKRRRWLKSASTTYKWRP